MGQLFKLYSLKHSLHIPSTNDTSLQDGLFLFILCYTLSKENIVLLLASFWSNIDEHFTYKIIIFQLEDVQQMAGKTVSKSLTINHVSFMSMTINVIISIFVIQQCAPSLFSC